MRRVWTEAGLKWDTDNDAEITFIFDDIEKAIDAKITAALKGGEREYEN